MKTRLRLLTIVICFFPLIIIGQKEDGVKYVIFEKISYCYSNPGDLILTEDSTLNLIKSFKDYSYDINLAGDIFSINIDGFLDELLNELKRSKKNLELVDSTLIMKKKHVLDSSNKDFLYCIQIRFYNFNNELIYYSSTISEMHTYFLFGFLYAKYVISPIEELQILARLLKLESKSLKPSCRNWDK